MVNKILKHNVKNKKFFLSKDESKILYGLAILLMIYHHLFVMPERLNNNYISILDFKNFDLELKIAIFCKMCVAIYAFISGYGLYVSSTRIDGNGIKRIKKVYVYIFKHLINFYKKYWLVFAIFIPMGFILNVYTFNIREFILSIMGKGVIYNVEWWYVIKYVKMLIVFPIIEFLLKKSSEPKDNLIKGIILFFALVYYFIFSNKDLNIIGYIMSNIYMVIFFVGILIARYKIFQTIYDICCKFKKKTIVLISLLSIFGVVLIRMYYAKEPTWASGDMFLTPILIFSFIVLLRELNLKRVSYVLKFIGKYSIYMWLTHTFFAYYYFQDLVLLPRVSILIYLWLIIISLITSIILEKIYTLLNLAFENIIKKVSKPIYKYLRSKSSFSGNLS